MLDLILNFIEDFKKCKGLIAIYIFQLFVNNSTRWFNLKNLIKLLTYCAKSFWAFIKTVGIQTASIVSQLKVLVKQSNKVVGDNAGLSFLLVFVLVFLLQLKLHNAGIIKLSSDKVIAISALILLIGLASAISKTKFTKIEMNNNEEL